MIAATLMGDAAAVDRLRATRDAAGAGIALTIAKLGADLRANVQQNKLSGQVLQARSGALRQSIAVRIDQSDTTVRASVYSDLGYAGAQEYGFSGTVNVRSSLRRIREAFGRPISPKTISVGPYSRRIDLPQRSFLRSALDDMAPEIRADIEAALREALNR